MHLEHCHGCQHRNGRRCDNPAMEPPALLPPAWWRKRGLHLVPIWCLLGPPAWPDDERANPLIW